MFNKKILRVISLFLITIFSIGIIGCKKNEEENQKQFHDSTKWFTEEELKRKGLEGISQPNGLTGMINSSDTWYNNGYSFSQACPNEETFQSNAETYFTYFKTHYSGKFGKTRIEKISISANENWYIIEPKSELNDFFDDNPSKLYKFYYVVNDNMSEGYFVKDSVWIFEIRYEKDLNSDQYNFKMFIESADKSHNGIYKNYYKIK